MSDALKQLNELIRLLDKAIDTADEVVAYLSAHEDDGK